MTPAQQLDIIRSVEAVESMDEEGVSKRDLEVNMKQNFRVDALSLCHLLNNKYNIYYYNNYINN